MEVYVLDARAPVPQEVFRTLSTNKRVVVAGLAVVPRLATAQSKYSGWLLYKGLLSSVVPGVVETTIRSDQLAGWYGSKSTANRILDSSGSLEKRLHAIDLASLREA